MTSELKILTNRQNAKKSTGPKTKTGKSRASRNAVRHGLERVDFGNSGYPAQVERLAKAICPDASDPFRYEQAVIIAESQIFLARVRAARIVVIERLRGPLEGENIRTVTKTVRLTTKLLREATKELLLESRKDSSNPAKVQECRDKLIQVVLLNQMLQKGLDQSAEQTLDETERLSRAIPELLSLERYERRALSRRRRAIRRFDALAD
jgi:hypothetical protein